MSSPAAARRDVILLVDDDEDVRTQLRRMILRHLPDVDILVATDGEEALRLLRERAVDLVITDQRMPRMSGVDLLAHLQSEGHDVARIVLTGYATMDVAQRAVNEGRVDAFFEKPVVDVFSFKERLRLLLDERRARREKQSAFERASARLEREGAP